MKLSRRRLPIILLLISPAFWIPLRRPSARVRTGWLADYDLLRGHTERAYANFGERLASRRIDPKALDETTRAALARARSRSQARAALIAFAGAFDDHHFQVRAPYSAPRRWLRRLIGKDRPAEFTPVPFSATGAEACAAAGAREPRTPPLDFSALPGWTPLAGSPETHPFPAGLLVDAQGAWGVVRIPEFNGMRFPAFCAARWTARARERTGACDEECLDDFSMAVEFALPEALAAEVEALRAVGATRLLVDLTGNGGGSSVAGPLARVLTALPLKTGSGGFIRHPHWVQHFTEAEGELVADLARTDLTARQRAWLESARTLAARNAREAAIPCDLSSLWTSTDGRAPCENIGRSAPPLDYAPPGALDGLESRGALFGDSQYPYREGVWRGPLWLLADGRTASASEQFIALLIDNRAAQLAGAPTLGIGCGFTNGGVRLELPATGLSVRAPDCVRFRADGTTEAAPIQPAVPIAWTKDESRAEKARRTQAALSGR